MTKFSGFVRYWLPAILWMMVIFFFSSRSRISVSDQPTMNFFVFKTLHVIEYATLYFLLFRGFFSLKKGNLSKDERLLFPFILAMIYAASDEWHQTFSAHREGTPRDVLIDTIGIFIMYSYIKRFIHFVKKLI